MTKTITKAVIIATVIAIIASYAAITYVALNHYKMPMP